jgi:S-formylglutathione hydrolase
MNFSIFLPSKAQKQQCPALYFLAGLSSSDENFMMKAGALRVAEELGLILVAPDTSPRNRHIERDNEHWTFGEGASFYVNATQSPWSTSYNMYDYIAFELPDFLSKNFLIGKKSLMGHSMGGHGALVIGLRNPDVFLSLSAFAPICAPMRSPWGSYALSLYLGNESSEWESYDTVEILKKTPKTQPILIDQGEADPFLEEQLRLDDLAHVARENNLAIEIRKHAGYDHSYYFVSTFIESHLRFHYKYSI